MKSVWTGAIASAVLALGAAAPGIANAQAAGSGVTWPHERGFWGHVGASVGGARLDATCPPGSDCDDDDQTFRVFGGGRFNNTFGGEVAYLKLGDFARGGGEIDAEGIDLALIAGVPFGNNWSVFGKLGALYSTTDVTANPGSGIQTGSDNGWGARFGVGLQMGLTDNWALRLDADRYRVKMPGGRDNVDTVTLGAQYTFR